MPAHTYSPASVSRNRSRGTLSLPRIFFARAGTLALNFFFTGSHGVAGGIQSGTVDLTTRSSCQGAEAHSLNSSMISSVMVWTSISPPLLSRRSGRVKGIVM